MSINDNSETIPIENHHEDFDISTTSTIRKDHREESPSERQNGSYEDDEHDFLHCNDTYNVPDSEGRILISKSIGIRM